MLPRGPKGWVRSDERILDELCERIAGAGVDASDLEVDVVHGEVHLEGSLATREERHLVVDLAQRVLGVAAVDAVIVVRAEADGAPEEPTVH